MTSSTKPHDRESAALEYGSPNTPRLGPGVSPVPMLALAAAVFRCPMLAGLLIWTVIVRTIGGGTVLFMLSMVAPPVLAFVFSVYAIRLVIWRDQPHRSATMAALALLVSLLWLVPVVLFWALSKEVTVMGPL